MQYEPILGIIGNVGPEADEFLQKLIRLRAIREGATRDQDFLPMLVVKNPLITDRTSAIFDDGPSPTIGIVESCRVLEKAGCFLAALPSNTSHYFRADYQSRTAVYVIDIIASTLRSLHAGDCTTVGLLGTTPTIRTGVFLNHAEAGDLTFVAPADRDQERLIQSAIYGSREDGRAHTERRSDGLKAGRHDIALDKILQAVDRLTHEGVDTFVCACTEISLIGETLRRQRPSLRFIDPMECLADDCFDISTLVIQLKTRSRAFDDLNVKDILKIHSHEQIAKYVSHKAHVNAQAGPLIATDVRYQAPRTVP
ncbi:aspartate/glutamate racemase family protein [Methylobacterium sp. NPDC080182]|uniref:aspartate/glutamate racemase family protein n=1 Tax=Methylobacterium sp. NPDC080182 TaxID=3390590 RepID=UPI003D05F04A